MRANDVPTSVANGIKELQNQGAAITARVRQSGVGRSTITRSLRRLDV